MLQGQSDILLRFEGRTFGAKCDESIESADRGLCDVASP